MYFFTQQFNMNILIFFCTKAANCCRLHLTIFSVYLSNFGLNYFLFLSLSISVRLFIITLISLHGFSLPPVVYRKPAPQTCSLLSVFFSVLWFNLSFFNAPVHSVVFVLRVFCVVYVLFWKFQNVDLFHLSA